jgi:nucleoid-associated protein YgaU
LVIFLILGVAIWGDGDTRAATPRGPVQNETLKSEDEKLDEFERQIQQQQRTAIAKQRALDDLFQPADPKDPDPPAPGPGGARNGRDAPVDPERPPAPERVTAETIHVVKKGEILESIALLHLGSRHRWREIVKANPGVSERNLKLGMKLRIPASKGAQRKRTGSAGTHVVKAGDSAWSIAESHYGLEKAPKYSKLILEINGIRDATALEKGLVLKLPK